MHLGGTLEERVALENRFAREVNMMSRVHHENLVKVSRGFVCDMSAIFLLSISVSS